MNELLKTTHRKKVPRIGMAISESCLFEKKEQINDNNEAHLPKVLNDFANVDEGLQFAKKSLKKGKFSDTGAAKVL